MGFKLNINFIIRQDIKKIEVEKEYKFSKDKLCIIIDDIPIFLASKDWTALAEIQVTSQERKDGKTSGTFIVNHIYKGDEQKTLSNVFRRMDRWK
ncbi:hypothetical protein ACFLY9_00875 [Patescibacteria group bacterium]